MNLEDVEEYYKKEIEKADAEFLEALNTGKGILTLEKQYKKKLESIREKYSELYGKALKHLGEKENQKEEKKDEGKKRFKVEKMRLRLSFSQRFSIRKQIFFFKTKIKIRGLINKLSPPLLMYSFFKIRISLKNFFSLLWESIKHLFFNIAKIRLLFKAVGMFFWRIIRYSVSSIKKTVFHNKESGAEDKNKGSKTKSEGSEEKSDGEVVGEEKVSEEEKE